MRPSYLGSVRYREPMGSQKPVVASSSIGVFQMHPASPGIVSHLPPVLSPSLAKLYTDCRKICWFFVLSIFLSGACGLGICIVIEPHRSLPSNTALQELQSDKVCSIIFFVLLHFANFLGSYNFRALNVIFLKRLEGPLLWIPNCHVFALHIFGKTRTYNVLCMCRIAAEFTVILPHWCGWFRKIVRVKGSARFSVATWEYLELRTNQVPFTPLLLWL